MLLLLLLKRRQVTVFILLVESLKVLERIFGGVVAIISLPVYLKKLKSLLLTLLLLSIPSTMKGLFLTGNMSGS